MAEKILSIFIDESGDFGAYEKHSPYYIVSLVFHDQSRDISSSISNFNSHLANLGQDQHAVHAGPLVRREADYAAYPLEDRKRLFNTLYHFLRTVDVRYVCVKVKKAECPDIIAMTSRVAKKIADTLRSKEEFMNGYDRIIIYYDNGQIELTKIITSVFNTLYTNAEFRKVRPADYKLFQAADMVCTLELISEKADAGNFSASESMFFGNVRTFRKNYLKPIRKKVL